MLKALFLSIAVLSILSLTGCRSAQVQNVPEQIIVSNKDNLTNDDVFKAIVRAGSSLGWIVSKKDNNTAIATLNVREHQAVVTVSYNTKTFSINYLSSMNLKYNSATNEIHSNYNGWISNLHRKIQAEINTL